jgi:hypothetical protein
MGSCPDFHLLFRAAKFLGVPPWELAAQSQAWLEWTLIEMQMETVRPKWGQDEDGLAG